MADQVRDLHAAIMNLPNQSDCYPDFGEDWHAGFAEGHRDARHTAAELAASHAAEVEALRSALERIAAIENEDFGPDWAEIEKARAIASAALKGDKP